MKKLGLCLLLFLLLACSADKRPVSSTIIPVDENIAEEASNYVTEGDEIGDGEEVYIIEDSQLKQSDTVIYPVFLEDETVSFLLCTEADREIIKDAELLEYYQSSKAHIFVLKDEVLYYCDSSRIYASEGTAEDINGVMERYEIKESEEVIKNRIDLKLPDTVSIDGREYAAGRIVVVFTEGEPEEMISSYEEFISGRYGSRIRSLKAYVFIFENRTASGLKELLESTLELEYVSNAWLEEVAYPSGSSQYPDK